MAIVINGSGTVTGISVGGLPDGIVDAGTLATNSVDSAELIDGAVDDSHMAAMAASKLTGALPAISGANLTGFTDAQMPTGSVLQVVTGELTTHVQMATTSWQNTGLSGTITPSSSSNKILITVSFGKAQTTHNNGDFTYSMRLLRNSSDSDLNGVAHGSRPRALFSQGGHSFNASHSMGGFSITGLDAPATTSAITYYVQAWPQSASYPLILNGTSNNSDSAQTYLSRTKAIITMMEIAG
jgi:hypothetical protein